MIGLARVVAPVRCYVIWSPVLRGLCDECVWWDGHKGGGDNAGKEGGRESDDYASNEIKDEEGRNEERVE